MIKNKRVSAILLLLAIAPHACAKQSFLNHPFDQLRNDLIRVKKYYLSKNGACNNKEQIEALQARRRLAAQAAVTLIGAGLCGYAIYGWQAAHTIVLANNDQPLASQQQEEQKLEQINSETAREQSQQVIIVSNEPELVSASSTNQEQEDNKQNNSDDASEINQNQENKIDDAISTMQNVLNVNQPDQSQQPLEQSNQQEAQEAPALLVKQESATDLIPEKKEKAKTVVAMLKDKSGIFKLAMKYKNKKNKSKKN